MSEALTLFDREPTHGIGTLRIGDLITDLDTLAGGWWTGIYAGQFDRLVSVGWLSEHGHSTWYRHVDDCGGGGDGNYPRRILGPLAELERLGAADIVPVPYDVTNERPARIKHEQLPADSWRPHL